MTADSCFKVGCILSREDFPDANLGLAEAYLRKALAVYEACASKANQDSEMLVARTHFKLATVVERSQAAQAAQAAPADGSANAPGIGTSIVLGTGTGNGGELDLLIDVAPDGVSPTELRELGLQALQRRLGPDQPIPSDVDATMATFDRLLFYWSR